MKIAPNHRKYILSLLLIFLLLKIGSTALHAQSYGLIFASHEMVPEQRTSLNLTPAERLCFKDNIKLSFEFSFLPGYNIYFGYIFRLINEKDQNIDLIYDQKNGSFHIITEEAFTDINFKVDPLLLTSQWLKLEMSIDAQNKITCRLKDQTWQSKSIALKSKCFKLCFGASNEHNFVSRDLPPMKLKNINISTDDTKQRYWALDESKGTVAEDAVSNTKASVLNPIWVKPRHSSWQLSRSIVMKGRPSFAFNPGTEELYIVGEDSVYSIPPKDTASANSFTAYSRMYAVNPSIYHPGTGKIYNIFTDKKKVREYDFNSNTWNGHFDNNTSEYWQVNKFFAGDNNLYILCGYGQLRYKNLIQRYNPITREWSILQPKGDFLTPRYLSALGTSATGDTAYLIGGFGSNKGDQLLSPKHFYDLLRYDVNTNTLKKIYTLPEPPEQFVFANSMVIDPDNEHYYALVFPNNRFNTNLQLIRGSLTQPGYTYLAQPFPYSFNDVRSFVDLYYCRKSNQLLAVTLFFENGQSEVKVYRIDFPPNELSPANEPGKPVVNGMPVRLPYIIASLGILLVLFLLVRRRYKGSKQTGFYKNIPEPSLPAMEPVVAGALAPVEEQLINKSGVHEGKTIVAGIDPAHRTGFEEELPGEAADTPKARLVLFGNFEAITVEGNNITRQFTPLLKEMFLLILIDSLRYNKGVSAEKLNEILWSDKDIKDANNNRSVNLVKLKSILDKLGGCSITRESGTWKFEHETSLIHIDLADYLNLFFNRPAGQGPVQTKTLIRIAKAGGFLQEIHYEWLDPVKAEISNYIVESLLKHADQLDVHSDTEEIITVCNAIFNFDELNEHALKLKYKSLIHAGRHTLANTTLTKFSAKYKEIYGQDFSESSSSLITH
jgi:DNA-binding SARP family transcriptional activator